MQSQMSITDGSFFVKSWPHKSISLRLKRPGLCYVKFSSRTQKQKEKQNEKHQFRLANDQYYRWKHPISAWMFSDIGHAQQYSIASAVLMWTLLAFGLRNETVSFASNHETHFPLRSGSDLTVGFCTASIDHLQLCSLAYGLNVVVIVVTVSWRLGVGGRETYYSV